MSGNRLRILLLSVLAVFAVSAVASASASATCYKVAVAGTGTFEKSTCEGAAGTKEWVKVSKLETELAPGEWCAKVETAGTGTFSDNKCTVAAGAKEFIKVLVPNREWEVQKCEAVAGGIFTNGTCEVVGAGGFGEAGVTEKLATGKTRKVTSASTTTFILNEGKTTEIKCTNTAAEGTITGGQPGTDKATKITFTGCTTVEAACLVRDSVLKTSGTIEVTAIPTKLEQRKKAGVTLTKPADNFEAKLNGVTKEFVTLEFTGTCVAFPPTTKVKGNIAAVVEGEVLNFPTNLEKPVETNSLEAFGVAATLSGKTTQKGAGGGKILAS